ncbi:MAG: carbohydrate-binding family 9-like protein [Pedobacter sp.]|jgi:hypothetical protein
MNFINYLLLISLPLFNTGGEIKISVSAKNTANVKPADAVYKVTKLKKPLKIDANWDKPEWKNAGIIKVGKYMGTIPNFKPVVEAKMMYDQDNVYVIFRVKDRFVRSRVQEYNGNVSGDSCVEFFFAPDSELPLKYFNLEINAGGTPLIFYVSKPWTEFVKLESSEIKEIEIAHSLPSKVDPEITEPVTWTIEYRIPLSMLGKFSNVTRPAPGVVWKANFYKTGSQTSNPNYITWNFVDNPKPNFHLPQFFGTLIFQ